MSIKLSCFDRFDSEKKSVAAIDSFNEKFYDYINRAAAGENPHKLKINKKWAKFIYDNSKMTFLKAIIVLIAIAPSFTKFLSFFTTPLVIKGCFLDKYPDHTVSLDDCIKYNNNSPFFQLSFTPQSLSYGIAYTCMFFLPHFYFIFTLWDRFRVNRLTFWISTAKIQLSTFHKRILTFKNYLFVLGMIVIIYIVLKKVAEANEQYGPEAYKIYFNEHTKLAFTFEKNDSDSIMGFISFGLIYSCLFLVQFAQIRQPTAFFVGFREYTKEASQVSYNVAAVEYRIKIDEVILKFIDRYYQECLRYDPRKVLIAMVNHFIDLEILEVEGAENDQSSSVPIKVKK